MRIKIFTGMSEKKLEAKVNEFLEHRNIEVIDIQFQVGYGAIGVMIRYKRRL